MSQLCDCTLSPHEQQVIEQGSAAASKSSRPRIAAMIKTFEGQLPALDIERALYFTRSMKATEGKPLVLRWAMALRHVAEHITVYIDDHQLLAGRVGKPGRYGIMYPEVEGDFYKDFLQNLDSRESSKACISPEDVQTVMEEIAPYWEGRTFHENFNKALLPEVRDLLFADPEGLTPRYVVNEAASWRSSLQWVHDYERVIRRGFVDIRQEAFDRLAALDPFSPTDQNEKRPFLEAVVIVSDAVMLWAKRHADLARAKAEAETDPVRKAELIRMAEACAHVPAYPARTFHEAVQSQWIVQLFSRLEQRTGTTISNGRMDQYLYPAFQKDRAARRLTEQEALELLECMWVGMAQFVEMYITAQGSAYNQGYAHWEAVTIGGQTPDGRDATNPLSHLFLKSKREFPLHYPDLAARVHSRSPEPFLWEIALTIKHGTGYPKLLNDEEIIPVLLSKGALMGEAYDYAVSGCTEARMPNRDTFTSGCASINMPAAIELVLYNGRMKKYGDTLLGVETGDPRDLATWEAFWEAFLAQQTHFLKTAYASQHVINRLRQRHFAQPMGSALHDLCMKYCLDLHTEHIPEGVNQGCIDFIGYGTLVDSLAAVKKHVYEDKTLTMDQLITALEADFKGYEAIQAQLHNSPCYGNNDTYVDSIGKAVERHTMEFSRRYGPELGVYIDTRYVPVTAHVPFGRVVSATPNGRSAWKPLSDGTSASHGADVNGPTGVLLSNVATKNWDMHNRASRMLNLKFSPKTLEGDAGTQRLISFIRSFVDLKLWHLQFNVVNRDTLIAAQKDPKKYASLIVRIAGYSAYFVDLSPDLQNDLIDRTEHATI